LNECEDVNVNKQVLVAFTIERYSNEVLCDEFLYMLAIFYWGGRVSMIGGWFMIGLGESSKENREMAENKENRVEPREKKEREPAERKWKTKMSFNQRKVRLRGPS
jgi:hypothetical protein